MSRVGPGAGMAQLFAQSNWRLGIFVPIFEEVDQFAHLRCLSRPRKDLMMDDQTRLELEAAAFRTLRDHLQKRNDVQNIDMMNLAGFCRNCLSRWYQEAAAERGIVMDKMEAREEFYGMPFNEWRDTYQTDATDAQNQAFEQAHKEAT